MTLASPSVLAGVVALIPVAPSTDTDVAVAPPIVTLAGAVNPVPTIITDCAPPTGPALGVILVTVGEDPLYHKPVLEYDPAIPLVPSDDNATEYKVSPLVPLDCVHVTPESDVYHKPILSADPAIP